MFAKKQFAKVGIIVCIIIIVGIIFIPNLRTSFMSGTKKYLKATGKVSGADTTTCGTNTGKCQFRVNYTVDGNSYYSTLITRTDPQKTYTDITEVDIYYPEDVTYYTTDDDGDTENTNHAKKEFEGQYKLSKPNKSVFILGIISLCLLIFSVFIYIF
jgi:hypothetical protein